MLNSSLSNQNQPDFDLKSVLTDGKLRGLWRLMTGFQLTYAGATLSLGLSALANTATFLLLRYFIDDYLGGKANIGLLLILGGFLGLALLQGGFTFLSRTLAARTAEGVVVRLRNYLYDHIQRLSFTYHDKTQTGDLMQRSTSDVDTIRRFFADQAIDSGRVTLLFLINFGALLYLNVKLALISVIVVPVVVIVSYFFFKRMGKLYEKYQEAESKLSTTLQENLSGVRVVKAFARQRYEEDKFDKINQEKYVRGKQLLNMHAAFWPVTDILCSIQMLAGFAVGATMAINGTITVGTYLAFAGLIVGIIMPIRNLGRLIVHMSEGLVSFGRLCEVLKQAREPVVEGMHQRPGKLQGELFFDNVSFTYNADDEPVLQNISFRVKPGQRVALLGSTGSGKTSLVNLLPRFYDYTGGCILLDGVELKEYNRHYLRQQIGIVEQEPFLFSRTVRENITYGVERTVSQAEVEDAAQAAAIHDVIVTKLPAGYDTLVGEKGITLSGGQKQRVALARTLLKDPRILILDDSTSSVDTETEALIRLALEDLMKNRTTFIIAHRIQTVMDADLILVMSHGRIVQRGKHAELLAQDGFYRKIYEAQTRIEQALEQELTQAARLEMAQVN